MRWDLPEKWLSRVVFIDEGVIKEEAEPKEFFRQSEGCETEGISVEGAVKLNLK